MSYLESVFFSLSIFIPGLVAVVTIKNADKTFYPFVLFLWLACLNEVVSLLMTHYWLNTAVNNNIYVLVEALVIGWQFRNWGLFQFSRFGYVVYAVILLSIWFIEFYPFDRIYSIGPYFRIAGSFLIVLMSLHLCSKLIYTYPGKLERSPAFIIGAGFIFYFTFKIFIEAFLIYGLTTSGTFYGDLFFILSCINLITNLLYTIALLCIPAKIYYTDPY